MCVCVHLVPRLPRKSHQQCTSSHACHAKEAETQGGTPGRTSDPLAVHIVPRMPGKRGGDPATPEGRQGVHPRRRPRDARGTPGRTSARGTPGRTPLAVHIVPRLPRKRRRPRDARGTPGRTSDPLAVHIVPRLPRKRGRDPGTPEGRQHQVPRLPRKRVSE